MRFFILIPVYQASAFLEGCLASVFAQSVQDFQIILVDDGSTDGSGAICDAYAKGDSRVRVIHQKNMGPYGARRAAIERCLELAEKTDWAVFLDADDSLKPNALEEIAAAAKREDADMVFLGEDQVWEGRLLRPFPVEMAHVGVVEDKRELYKIVFQDGWYNPLWKKAVSVSLLPAQGVAEYYPVRFGEDLLQSIPMYASCRRAVFLKESLYNYAINPQSATNALRYEKYQCSSLVIRECWAFLKSQNVWNEADFTEYLGWLRRLTRFQVWIVAKFQTSVRNRCRLLKEIRADAFYRMVIDSAPRKDVTLGLMGREHYVTLCLLGTLLRLLGRLRRWVKR